MISEFFCMSTEFLTLNHLTDSYKMFHLKPLNIAVYCAIRNGNTEGTNYQKQTQSTLIVQR